MAKAILTNVRLFAGAVDLTAMNNRIEVDFVVDTKDVTNFGSVDANGVLWKEMLAGLFSGSLTASGFWEAGGGTFVDDDMWLNFGGVGPWSAVPNTIVEGQLAYLVNAVRTSYGLGDEVGEVIPFSSEAQCTGAFSRGAVLLSPSTPRTATGAGTVVQLGAVPAGKAMRAGLHVVSIAGTTPTLVATLQSATTLGFGSPTTRATFTTVNAAAGGRTAEFIASTTGPITDQYWRIAYTITGATPSYVALATAGIG